MKIKTRYLRWASTVMAGCIMCLVPGDSQGCCAVTRDAGQVVNASQTVIILWDSERKTQHFIRQASFKSDSNDVGFIVPTPSQPELEESGDAAFGQLRQITAPVSRGGGSIFPLGCAAEQVTAKAAGVEVLERKRVAGFDAVVLKAGSSEALVGWLAGNGYAYSPQVAEWAEPYIAQGWPFTALKVAASKSERSPGSGGGLDAAALRISFKTDVPLFPYREPDSGAASKKLSASNRLLRIYFIGEAAYEGSFPAGKRWTGRRVWSGNVTAHKASLLAQLKLPSETGPRRWWLTEFEDRWPYAPAPGDVTFSRSRNQSAKQRYAVTGRTGADPLLLGFALFATGAFLRRRVRGIQ